MRLLRRLGRWLLKGPGGFGPILHDNRSAAAPLLLLGPGGDFTQAYYPPDLGGHPPPVLPAKETDGGHQAINAEA